MRRDADGLRAWWSRQVDVTAAGLIAVATAGVLGALAALGGSVGAPSWLRVLVGALVPLALGLGAMLQWHAHRLRNRALRKAEERGLKGHYGPIGRGVSAIEQPGQYFTGRVQVLRELVGWLEKPSHQRGYVVTGDPGAGKSAVLGRLVRLSDPVLRGDSLVERAPLGTVPRRAVIDLAVHVRDKTLADVVAELAYGLHLRVDLPESGDPRHWEHARSQVLAALASRRRRAVVVVDAVDEATGEGEGRRIAQQLLKPLTLGDGRLLLLVGTRRGPRGELVRALGSGYRMIDLDTPAYLAVEDLVEYARRQLVRDQEPDEPTPYRGNPELTEDVANAIGQRALPNFLVCQLVSRRRALEREPVDTSHDGWKLEFPKDVGDAMEDYLDLFGRDEEKRRRARDLLTAVAFAEGPGLAHDELWPFLASRLADRDYSLTDIDWLLDSRAADLLHEVRTPDGNAWYRLFHQALVDHLRASANPGRRA